ncbi:MAG: cysteine dioxygenase [Magnetovibrionaceae bacterium]
MRDNVNLKDLTYRDGYWLTKQQARNSPLLGAPAGSAPSAGGASLERVLPVTGQGTVSFEFTPTGPFSIVLSSENENHVPLELQISEERAAFICGGQILSATAAPGAVIKAGERIPYWFSLDTNNRRLRYGKGYMAERWTVLQYNWPESSNTMNFTASLKIAKLVGDISQGELDGMVVQVWPLPVVRDRSPYIIDRDQMTLEIIEDDTATVVEDLTEGCQILYANVAGSSINLSPPDFPDFAEAIGYSILTPGCVCFEILKKKAEEAEFGKEDPNATYLRITIGPNGGNSPGVPFVLEIWPGGHYSPIHNHGDADAIIKVLHGSLTANIYPTLSADEVNTFRSIELKEGDVTWLTPAQQQTHQLYNHNPAGQFCATIQCYRYPDDDTIHYEYFDFINPETKQIEPFKPNTDMPYGEFKVAVKAEWDARKKG